MRAISAGGALVPAAGHQPTTVMPAEAAGAYHGAVGTTYDGDRLDRYDDDDRRDRRDGSSIWPWIVVLLLLVLIGGGVAAFLLTRPKKALVPTVVGLPLNVAQNKVQNAGFTPNPFPLTSRKPVDQVIAQSPLGQARVKEGATVTLTYSTGPGNTTVPLVTNESPAAARRELRHNGLNVSHVTTTSSSSVPQGQVISTSPGAGASVSNGSSVSMVVSSGEPMPNVVNDSLGDAQVALSNFTNAGTQLLRKYQVSSSAQPDTVISQYPLPNQPLPKGSAITLTIAKAPDTVKMPRVVDQTPTNAAATLGALGLSVNPVQKITHNLSLVGIVIKQNPTSLSIVKKGTIVTIWVGQAPPSSTTSTPTTTATPPPPTTSTASTTTT